MITKVTKIGQHLMKVQMENHDINKCKKLNLCS